MIFGDRCFIIENDHLVELFSVLKTVLSFFVRAFGGGEKDEKLEAGGDCL